MTPGAPDLDIDVGDGLRVHVTRSGDGPPLVLLHGFTGSAETWSALRAALRERYTVIAPDLAGHGASSTPDDPARYALTRFAHDLARVLDELRLDRVAVLGYSLGGRAALRFALEHPERTAALVLESASPGITDSRERAERAAADAALAELIERDGMSAFVDRWERLPLWASQASLPAESRERLRAQRLGGDPSGLANSLRGAGAGTEQAVVDRLGDVAAPTLLVAGALDAKYVALGRRMEAAMPAARLVVVAGAGHAVHLERPTEFAALVARFLDDDPSGEASGVVRVKFRDAARIEDTGRADLPERSA